MFSHQNIKARLNEKPFRPVRIIVSEGLSYDVHHPDLVWVGLRGLQIGFPGTEDPTVYDRTVRVAMVHVVALEDLPFSSPSPTSNGSA